MRKFQIENVLNYIGKNDKIAVASYFPLQDKCSLTGYLYEETVSWQIRTGFEVGIWRIKCLHDWKTNITEQYQQCYNCGIGHAL